MKDLGSRLRALREEKGLTQEQVANRLNMHKSTVFNYEANARSPSLSAVINMALLYEVPTDYILGLDKRQFMCIDGITKREREILQLLYIQFKEK